MSAASRDNAAAQPAWLAEAWQLLGVRERGGPASNERILNIFRDSGHPGVRHDETAWCAAFVGACLERAGVGSMRSLRARSYADWGRVLDHGRYGALAVLSRGSDPSLGHVGFWIGETARQIILLGGNQNDSVSVAAFDRSRLVALRWPPEDAVKPNAPGCIGAGFERALAHILEMEGGYGEDPYDPGGPTNFGITLKVYAGWVGTKLTRNNAARLKRDLKNIPHDVVRAIYEAKYWRAASCPELPLPLAVMHFDAAVNQGVARAIRMLQEAAGTGVDGEIGPLTRAALARQALSKTLVAYAAIRRRHYRSLHHFWRFGRGWLRRVTITLALARHMMTQPNTEGPTSQCANPLQKEKGETSMANQTKQQPAAKWWGQSVTIWGAVMTALSTVLPTLGPVIGLDLTPELVKEAGGQLVTTVQALVGLLGTLMTIYGRARASQRIELRNVHVRL